ncbi:MAG: HD-GYP domain-containing protein [Candidatus Hydrogenedentota bacterium]|nr:MAG: HD-GYP domain-containing protein [Candidatus Hydrogenedentota bacterium]
MADPEALLHSGREIAAHMIAVSTNVAMYSPEHPTVIEPATRICELLKPLFAHRQRVSFHIMDSEIYFEKQLLREERIKDSDFIQLLMHKGVSSLSFEPDVTPQSLAIFFSLISDREATDLSEESLRTSLKGKGVKGIDFEKFVGPDFGKDVHEPPTEEEGTVAIPPSYDRALEHMESVERDVLENRPVDANTLRPVISSLMEDFLGDRKAVMRIMSIKTSDEHLFHHSVNVAITSLLIANKLLLRTDLMNTVGIGGLLHDIGMLKIPREIINKPGRLTESEWTVMRRHPIEGAQILTRFENLGELPVLAALEHHSGYDLSGYPTLKGKERPHALARIVGIADVYEAMTADRSHRRAPSIHRAVRVLIDGAGKQFDPLLVKLLLNITGAFPPGSAVRFSTGETAIVVEANEDNPFSPKVRTVRDRAGNPTEGPLINTAEDPARYAIAGIADSEQI